jgi:hypothetical protein
MEYEAFQNTIEMKGSAGNTSIEISKILQNKNMEGSFYVSNVSRKPIIEIKKEESTEFEKYFLLLKKKVIMGEKMKIQINVTEFNFSNYS